VDIRPDYRYKGVRSYRVSGEKLKERLGLTPEISIEASVADMAERIRSGGVLNFDDPIYYNIDWMKTLEKADEIIKITGRIF
jgi:hypothetical protein